MLGIYWESRGIQSQRMSVVTAAAARSTDGPIALRDLRSSPDAFDATPGLSGSTEMRSIREGMPGTQHGSQFASRSSRASGRRAEWPPMTLAAAIAGSALRSAPAASVSGRFRARAIAASNSPDRRACRGSRGPASRPRPGAAPSHDPRTVPIRFTHTHTRGRFCA